MIPEQPNRALMVADAAARRLLTRVIDLRFNLEDAIEASDGQHGPSIADLWQLRAEADVLCREIDALADALWPAATGLPAEADEECEASTEICGT